MHRKERLWRHDGPLARVMSVIVTMSMVLSLLPAQGVAEAGSELNEALTPATEGASEEVQATPTDGSDTAKGDEAARQSTEQVAGDTQQTVDQPAGSSRVSSPLCPRAPTCVTL